TVHYLHSHPDYSDGFLTFILGLDIPAYIHPYRRDFLRAHHGAYVFDSLRKRTHGAQHHVTKTPKDDRDLPEPERTQHQHSARSYDYGRSAVGVSVCRSERQ